MHLESIDWYVFEENIPEWMKRNTELTAMEIAVYEDNQIKLLIGVRTSLTALLTQVCGLYGGFECELEFKSLPVANTRGVNLVLTLFIKLGDIMKDFIGSLLLFAMAYAVLWLAMAIY